MSSINEKAIQRLYGSADEQQQLLRYTSLLDEFHNRFATDRAYLFSSPGRTELGGNHTDHNHGKVLAGSIQLDKIAAVTPRDDMQVEIVTAGFPKDIAADLHQLQPQEAEAGRASALVRGIAAYFAERGYGYGGFSAYVHSQVAMGSGLSSSASIEVLIAQIFNTLYHQGRLSAIELAQAGRYAENQYFKKPCGLMDQIACAQGGIAAIDFTDSESPGLEQIDFDFSSHGYQLMILDTGGDHADLTHEYASIPQEMRCVAAELGCEVLGQTDLERLTAAAHQVRQSCGDRPFLRALHYFQENRRVELLQEALQFEDINAYLRIVGESGTSSWTLLQNCIPTGAVQDQSVAYSLGLLQSLCPEGVFRVHGGGFAGTVQGYVPVSQFKELEEQLNSQFGEGAVTALRIRSEGVIHLDGEFLD
ncbi:MAG: galactokinase [Spirochaetaceae bacterium]|nr:galactokinase [Spirochaetaceae bacterium]MCF7947076.1 galactokinase [Spirochaetia bacterium]MCF7950077.1 galactokinase [Spirochaetaceae bacterium]